jgi:hypothetical protein
VIPSGNGSGEDEDCVFVAKAKGEWNGVDDKKHAVRSSNRDICYFVMAICENCGVDF